MAISKAQKAAYNDDIKALQADSNELEKRIRELASKKKSKSGLEPYYNLEIVTYLTHTIDLYIQMSDLSVTMLGIKNSKSLDAAKSNFLQYRATINDLVKKLEKKLD